MPITLGDVSIGSSSGTVETGSNIHIKNINGVIGVGDAALGYGNVAAFGRASTAGFHINGSAVGDLCIGAEFGKSVLIGTAASGALQRRMQIDGSGRVTTPSQPSFRASNTPNSSFSGSGQSFACNVVHHNIGNHYNSSNGLFTAPVPGSYCFQYSVTVLNGNGNASTEFRLNGTTVGQILDYPGASASTHSITVYLNANDTFGAFGRGSNNGDWTVWAQAQVFFSGILIG